MDRVEYQSIIIQDIINLEKAGELNLSPWYQRRSVWSESQKSYLINTLLEQKPMPAIYIRHSIDLEKGKSIREVVDGQQRSRTIISYVKDGFSSKHPAHNKKVKYSQLSKDQQQRLLLTSIPVGYLLGASDGDVIDIFGRINSISKTLNDQEKRNAMFSGEFKQFCLKQASSRVEFWRKYNIFSATDISRMLETQFISDVVMNMINGLSDFSPKKLNDIYKQYEDEFNCASEIEVKLDRVFDLIVDLDPTVITDTIFKRQPIFFSLLLAINSLEKVDKTKLETGLLEMDAIFNDDTNKSNVDTAFHSAATNTTQRIAQRKIRNDYILKFLK